MAAPETFENYAQMTAMLKRSLDSDYMFLVLWVCLFEFIEYLHFLEASFVPARDCQCCYYLKLILSLHRLLAANDLYGDLPSASFI